MVLVAAGGTGGHVFPALALIDELRRLGTKVIWIGRDRGLEREVAAEHGVEFVSLPARGFYGKKLWAKALGLWFGLIGMLRALVLLRRIMPHGVVATGGFASAAVLAAALICRVPFFLLEQNCIPGRVTRFFACWARKTFLGFAPAKPLPGCYEVTGNPLRGALVAGGRSDDGRTVLVLGGSQGARALNLAALDAAAALTTLNFIVLTGRRDYDYIRGRRSSTKNCEVVDFTLRPEELYRRATICVSRAGGMVLSELVAFNIPAILVPFPYATDRHQDANAQHLAAVGAASVLDQTRLSGLTSAIRALMDDEPRRRRMEQAARTLARPDAARVIAERIVEMLAGSNVAQDPEQDSVLCVDSRRPFQQS
ncbi:MAG: UDP-N-acetylglucosamine--N-acetylmuramyl-(pentapeptide) pyrophosphoryl-undecaprenol N-acetylglucosamine transferase [candidate division WOR-3 bacterium]